MTETNTARAFWIQEPGRGEIVSAPLSPRRDGDVLVRTLFSGISRGTESLVFRGEVPTSQYDAMRAPFQEGRFPGPVKYGYASVGRVEAPRTSHLSGRTVCCLYPHQDLYHVPADAVVPLPNGLPAERAVLAAYMETAVNAVWDAAPTIGDRIVVIGAGALGLLVGWLCRGIRGTDVIIVDIDERREAVARELNLPFLREPPYDRGADLVVHASGSPDGLRAALAAPGREGTVVELSWYGERIVDLPLGEAFHSRRLTIRSSQVSEIPPLRAPRWDRKRRMRLALDLLRDPALDVLVSGESDFDDLPSVMTRLCERPEGVLCHRIRYPSP